MWIVEGLFTAGRFVRRNWSALALTAILAGAVWIGWHGRGRWVGGQIESRDLQIQALSALGKAYASQQQGWREAVDRLRAVDLANKQAIARLSTAKAEAEVQAATAAAAASAANARAMQLVAELDARPIAGDCETAVWQIAAEIEAIERGESP